jgi:hypothetical protein
MEDNHFYNPIDDYKQLPENMALIFMPVCGLIIKDKIKINSFTLYPKFRVDFEWLNFRTLLLKDIENYDFETQQDLIREKEKDIFDTFATHTLLVFPFEIYYPNNYNYDFEMQLLIKLTNYTELVINIIRYYECGYMNNFSALSSAGYCRKQFSTILVHLVNSSVTKIHAGQILNFVPITEATLSMQYVTHIENHNLTRNDVNEVGNVAKQALQINSSIINSNSNNGKFLLLMQLIDFLMLPYEYGNFKKIKGNLICHIVNSKSEYHKLSERFIQLTDEQGLRTKIIHGGYNIDDLLTTEEIIALFKELHYYIAVNIDFMIKHYNKSWFEFEQIRKELKEKYQ